MHIFFPDGESFLRYLPPVFMLKQHFLQFLLVEVYMTLYNIVFALSVIPVIISRFCVVYDTHISAFPTGLLLPIFCQVSYQWGDSMANVVHYYLLCGVCVVWFM